MTINIDDLANIIAKLRAPDGCPWDKVQTHETLQPYFIEEVYEVIEAIQNNDLESLKDELGDVLLQIVLHSQLASERNDFSLQDVIDSTSQKMIRRHPHVFENTNVEHDEESLSKQWESIKASEKKSGSSSIPAGPALFRAQKVSKLASKKGFDWEDAKSSFEKVTEEIQELEEAIKEKKQVDIEEEYGDLLFALVNVSRHLKIDSELALTKATKKFENRFAFVQKAITNAESKGIKLTLDEMEIVWQKAKKELAKK